MLTLAISPPICAQPEYLPPAGEAVFYDREVRRAARTFKSAIMAIAYYGARMRALGMFAQLGFESEDVYRDSIDVPRSTWYKAVRIGEALYELPLVDLQALSTGNAELLIQIDPILWNDYPWVTEAKQLDTTSFAGLVAQRNRQSGSSREVYSYYRCRVPYTAKKFIEEAVEAFRQKNELASASQALEFMVADRYDTPNFMETLIESRRILAFAIRLLERREVKEITEEMYLLKKSRRLLDEIRQDKVSAAEEAASSEDNEERP